MYYRAKKLAINNGRAYHLAAILRRWASHMHAEMNVLRFAEAGDVIEVLRFKGSDYDLTMAKPCLLCVEAMKLAGIKKVRYTNWIGEWEEMFL